MLKTSIANYLNKMQYASIAKDYTATHNILEDMKTELRASPPNIYEVIDLLNEIIENPDVPYASLVFVSAWFNLSQLYVPPLCKVVLSASSCNWHEQAIDLLGSLANNSSISALRAAVDYRWDYDEFYSVPKKALDALFSIGNPEAIEVIRQASKSSDPVINEEALSLLQQRH